MKKTKWGPCIWFTLHILTIKIQEKHFEKEKEELIDTILNICNNLPCPYCSSHATEFLKKKRIQSVKTKEQLIKILFDLHNNANNRLKKKTFEYEEMFAKYTQMNTKDVLNDYYNTCMTMK